MKKRLLITGASGFLGNWVIHHWRKNHPGIKLWASGIETPNPSFIPDNYIQADLCDFEAVRKLVSLCSPDEVIHLAGLIGKAELTDHLRVNVIGTENLFKALLEMDHSSKIRVVQASSASIYGIIRPEELPVTEKQEPRPMTSYALSKLTQQYLGASMWTSYGLQVINACIFNIIGPYQSDFLVPMTFVKQLKEVKAGLRDRLNVGNIAPSRDFIDVRDVVRAFNDLLEKGEPGETYNVASSRDVSIKEIIDLLMRISGLQVSVKSDSDCIKTTDVPCVRGDISKITSVTDWEPAIPLEKSLRDVWIEAIEKNTDAGRLWVTR